METSTHDVDMMKHLYMMVQGLCQCIATETVKTACECALKKALTCLH